MSGTFFNTDRAYQIPYPTERDFHPFPEMLSDDESESDDGGEYAVLPAPPPPAVAAGTTVGLAAAAAAAQLEVEEPEIDKATRSLISKMRVNAYEARRKKVELQELNLTKMWPLLTSQMSAASLAKVREFP